MFNFDNNYDEAASRFFHRNDWRWLTNEEDEEKESERLRDKPRKSETKPEQFYF